MHRRYIPHSHAHYGGDLVDGAYVLGLFGDVATELCIRTDGDEGLFASYDDIQFAAPVQAGDVVEVTATVTRVGPSAAAGRRRGHGLHDTLGLLCVGIGAATAISGARARRQVIRSGLHSTE
jgi:3-aminobutyryl-CoA ammonia-lyase